jgi:hypothetical protein
MAHYYPEKTEVDHGVLIKRLCDEFPDGWALSTTSVALRDVLPLCPSDARIGSWTKPFASFKPGINPAYCWEPVIFRGGRKRTRNEQTVRDFVSAGITLRRGIVGAKPEIFCFWIFEILGLAPDDELVDLFPGSGAVSRAWEVWKNSLFVKRA